MKDLNSQLQVGNEKSEEINVARKGVDQHLNHKTSYVPREILDKLRKVQSLKDFVAQFNPQGVHKEKRTSFGGKDHYVLHEQEHDFEGQSNEVDLTEPKDFGCKPRPKIVPVPADYNSVFWPSCVELYQCGGCCLNAAHFECVPSALQNRSTTVFRIPLNVGGQPVAHKVFMVHHSHCKCACRVRARDCLPTQTYDSGNCQCECRKKQEQCPYGKQWSQRQCRCICSYVGQCPKRFIWDDSKCRCVCKRTKKCRKYTVLDPSTCKCIFLNQNFDQHQ